MSRQNFYWLITLLLGVLLIDFYFQVKNTSGHFYDSKWFMWRVLFIAILIFFVLLQQLQATYKKEKYSIYFIIKELYRDKFTLATENQKLQPLDSKVFSLNLNIPFTQRLSNFITKLESKTKVSISFSFQKDSEIEDFLFLQFLISEIVKGHLSLPQLKDSTGVNITIRKIGKECISLIFVSSFHNTFKISTYNPFNHIIYAFNGKYKIRLYRKRLEIEILLPLILN
ncbi:MAG: hypothetical protein ACP5P3_01530 [Ignavibacteria bacterium]